MSIKMKDSTTDIAILNGHSVLALYPGMYGSYDLEEMVDVR